MKPLATFFALAYGISWLIWFPLYAPAWGIEGLPKLPYHHAWGGFGPMVAGFLTTWIFDGRVGLRQMLARCIRFRPISMLLIALLSPFVLLATTAGALQWIAGQEIQWNRLLVSTEFPEFNFLVFCLYNVIFFGFGEEVGWRGFALPRMQLKMNALMASLLLTVFWALWHWPLFLYRPGYVSMGMGGIVGWVLSLLTGSILLTWLFNSSRGSILIVAIFHATIDIAFTADLGNAALMNAMGFLVTLWGIATIFIFKPRDLAGLPRSAANA